MIINRNSKDKLHVVEEDYFSEQYAADFFCRYTYEFLYVKKDGKIISVVTKEDVSSVSKALPSLERYEVLITNEKISDIRAEELFRERPYLNRLAVLDKEHNLVCEFDNNSLPQKSRNVVKNEMALRYVSLIEDEIRTFFDEKGWKSVLVMGSKEIYLECRRTFYWLDVSYSENYTDTDCDVIFNFRYTNQLMKYFCCDNRINDLYKIVEKLVFRKAIKYFDEKGIEYYLLRAATYDTLTCLSPLEEKNRTEHPSQRSLISDDDYMSKFADEKERRVLQSGRHLDSYAEDNGWMFIQHDIESEFINVSCGMRKTVRCAEKPVNSVHLYGSCLMYSFYADDESTIPSLLQKNEACSNMQVYNHGALLGRNLMNMCIGALTTVYHPGDIVVILDIFEDIGDDEGYHFVDTSLWFNSKKPTDEVWFLDFPLHCNKHGNKVYADGIAELIANREQRCYDRTGTMNYIQEHEKKPRCVWLLQHSQLSENDMLKIQHLVNSIGAELTVTDATDENISEEYFVEHKAEAGKRTVILHYGCGYDYHAFPAYHFFIESADMLTAEMLKEMSGIMEMQRKKVLLYLGKFPEKTNDVDGGAQLAHQLIGSLSENCCLDVTFIRKESETYSDEYIEKIRYEEYIDPKGNKFSRRLKNIDTNRSAVLNGECYDLVIAAHCSKLFGLEDDQEIMEKSVIFPMMLTGGYKRAGEEVLPIYTRLEEKVLNNVDKIITPSIEEQTDIMNDYPEVSSEKIKVIPRGINPVFHPKSKRENSGHPELVSIGSFKLQKNHTDELDVLMKVKAAGMEQVHLTIIGAVHDRVVYEELLQKIRDNDLNDMVTIYNNIDRKEIAGILENMDISISCSRWETFGRGIFEGMTAGLPSVLSSSLSVIRRYAEGEKEIGFFDSTDEMADYIVKLCSDSEIYHRASEAALRVSRKVSFFRERECLITELLYRRFAVRTQYMDWDTEGTESIYCGAYSECIRKNNRVRKYFRYPEYEKILSEFAAQKCAYENGILSAEPLFFSFDKSKNKWFIESRYVETASVEKENPDHVIQKCDAILDKMKKLPVDQLRPFSCFFDEMSDALDNLSHCYNVDVENEKQLLKSLDACCFTHGDMLLKNIGICGSDLYVFDFQNSCCGPEEWDKAYILSEYTPEMVSDYTSDKLISLILLILKIRTGRACRRNSDTSLIGKRLHAWEMYQKGRANQ